MRIDSWCFVQRTVGCGQIYSQVLPFACRDSNDLYALICLLFVAAVHAVHVKIYFVIDLKLWCPRLFVIVFNAPHEIHLANKFNLERNFESKVSLSLSASLLLTWLSPCQCYLEISLHFTFFILYELLFAICFNCCLQYKYVSIIPFSNNEYSEKEIICKRMRKDASLR